VRFGLARSLQDLHRGFQYYWVFRANNNKIICQSESYVSKEGAKNSIQVVKTQGPGGGTNDKSGKLVCVGE
jgi:uncharacterized protein YegP (UPF0339 family)